MARLVSNSEYIGVVLACSESCGSAPRAQRISLRLLLEGQVGNVATIIRNNRGMLKKVEESFPRCLDYCIDNNGGHFEHFV
jgi:hypothetical protein